MVMLSICAWGGRLRTTTCLLLDSGPDSVVTVSVTVYVPLSAKMWQVTAAVLLHGCGCALTPSPKFHCQAETSLDGLVRSLNWMTRPSAASFGDELKSTMGGTAVQSGGRLTRG